MTHQESIEIVKTIMKYDVLASRLNLQPFSESVI